MIVAAEVAVQDFEVVPAPCFEGDLRALLAGILLPFIRLGPRAAIRQARQPVGTEAAAIHAEPEFAAVVAGDPKLVFPAHRRGERSAEPLVEGIATGRFGLRPRIEELRAAGPIEFVPPVGRMERPNVWLLPLLLEEIAGNPHPVGGPVLICIGGARVRADLGFEQVAQRIAVRIVLFSHGKISEMLQLPIFRQLLLRRLTLRASGSEHHQQEGHGEERRGNQPQGHASQRFRHGLRELEGGKSGGLARNVGRAGSRRTSAPCDFSTTNIPR